MSFLIRREYMYANTQAPSERFRKVPPSGLRDRKGEGVEGMEGKLNGNYMKLIPGLCLEDRMN